MGTYIRFKTDTPEKVNALFAYMNRDNLDGDQIDTGTRVVISQATIMEDIAYINVDPSQVELRHIKTVDDWNKTFPVLAEGCGQIKLSGGDLTATKKAIIDFVISNQELFTKIEDESGEYISKNNIYTLKVTSTYYLQVAADSKEEAWANRDTHIANNFNEIMKYAEFNATGIINTGETT